MQESLNIRTASESIDELNHRFSKGFELNDPSLTASVYAEDSVLFPPDSGMVQGLEGIERFWSETMRSGVKEAKLTTMEITGAGEFLNEKGTGTLKIQQPGGEPQEKRLKYVVVWKRTEGGWKNHWDIWNWSP